MFGFEIPWDRLLAGQSRDPDAMPNRVWDLWLGISGVKTFGIS
jgi:hypothetical protein